MQCTKDQLHELFVIPGHITEHDFTEAVAAAQEADTPIEVQFGVMGLLRDSEIAKTIADAIDTPFCDLATKQVEVRFLEIIPELVARAQAAVVYGEDENTLFVATLHPDNYEFKKLLQKKVGKEVMFAYAAHGALTHALDQYRGDYKERITALLAECHDEHSEGKIVEFVALLLEYGYESKASDIHIEPHELDVKVRFRVDGALHEVASYQKMLHDQVSFRIKILARLQTDERGKAQDGRFSHLVAKNTFDIRVSIIPVTNGENIVLRLLSAHARQYTLNTLGFKESDHSKILHALRQPHGMVLAVGPTGSGKTTVLYSMLAHLNTPEVNIMTIEDPVEYDVENVQQTQVNKSKDLTFASGLRAIVRQDPDIIMVGEIRDEETADIAVNAALTGHLLLSTLHTNDAATTFPRLGEMGVEPFLVASSVQLIVSLRLVRTLCAHCKESYFLTPEELALVNMEPQIKSLILRASGKDDLKKVRFFRGVGCKTCNYSGFRGRSAIFEVLEVDEAIRMLLSKQATSEEIHEAAVRQGMQPLLHDGIAKALQGVTTIREVIKAVHS